MTQALKEPAETQARTFSYHVVAGSGALAREFYVELDRPLRRDPNDQPRSFRAMLREAADRAGQVRDPMADPAVVRVRQVNPITGERESISIERFKEALRGEDVHVAPIVRMR